MKKLAAGILVAGVLAVGTLAVRQWQSLHAESELGAQLRDRVTALEATQLAAATASPQPAMLPVAATLQSVTASAPGAVPAAPGTAQPAAPPAANAPVNMVEAALADPANLEMTRNMMRMMMPQQYPDLARDLNLSPAEVEKLFDTLARQQMDLGMGSMDMFTGRELSPAAMQEMERKMQQQQKANDAELSAMLGSKYQQWLDYQGTAAARQQVEQLQAVLDTDNRLSEAGRKSVIAALAIEESRIDREERSAPQLGGGTTQEVLENQLKRAVDGNQRRLAAASPHLTVAQRDAYRRLLEQQTNMATMMMRSMTAPAGAKP
jgi:hypothetical protein